MESGREVVFIRESLGGDDIVIQDNVIEKL